MVATICLLYLHLQALTNAGILDSETARAYGQLFSRFMRQQRKAHLDWEKLTSPGRGDMVVDYDDLEHCPAHEPLQHVRADQLMMDNLLSRVAMRRIRLR